MYPNAEPINTELPEEIARIDDQNNLISEPFVDSLARIQQEKNLAKITARQIKKSLRDKKLVGTYLRSKFPDAFSKEMTVPDRKFPNLLRIAKNKYIRRIIAGATGIPVGITMIIIGAIAKTEAVGIPVFFGGSLTAILCTALGIISLAILIDGE